MKTALLHLRHFQKHRECLLMAGYSGCLPWHESGFSAAKVWLLRETRLLTA
jgi:hypothetical protein